MPSATSASRSRGVRRRRRPCSTTNETVIRPRALPGPTLAEPDSPSRRLGRARGPCLCRAVRARHSRPAQAARNRPDDPVAEGGPVTAPPDGLVQGFLDALAADRGASLNTIEAYRRDLSDYVSYLREKGE